METLFNDNVKSNSPIRAKIISFLLNEGFFHAGTESRSGKLELIEKTKKVTISFGVRSNIGGKQNKYFTLSKDFASKKDAMDYFNSIKENLTQLIKK